MIDANCVKFNSDTISLVALAIALLSLVVAFLRHFSFGKAHKIDRTDKHRERILAAQLKFNEVSLKVIELKNSSSINADASNAVINSAVEYYLNSLDWFAADVLGKKLHNCRSLKLTYRILLKQALLDHDSFFPSGGPYHNIEKLDKKWSTE